MDYSERRLELFWAKVDRSGECWEWTGSVLRSGYGAFLVKDGDRWRTVMSHRYSYSIQDREWPAGWVLHHCDNRLCVRPDHLYSGGPKENAQDAVARDRLHTKLSRDQVVELRERRDAGEGVEALAELFGVSPGVVSSICLGRSRQSCGGPIQERWSFRKCEDRPRRKRRVV